MNWTHLGPWLPLIVPEQQCSTTYVVLISYNIVLNTISLFICNYNWFRDVLSPLQKKLWAKWSMNWLKSTVKIRFYWYSLAENSYSLLHSAWCTNYKSSKKINKDCITTIISLHFYFNNWLKRVRMLEKYSKKCKQYKYDRMRCRKTNTYYMQYVYDCIYVLVCIHRFIIANVSDCSPNPVN